jgi:hypothetical protein
MARQIAWSMNKALSDDTRLELVARLRAGLQQQQARYAVLYSNGETDQFHDIDALETLRRLSEKLSRVGGLQIDAFIDLTEQACGHEGDVKQTLDITLSSGRCYHLELTR